MQRTAILITAIISALLLHACASLGEDPTRDWSAEEFYKEASKALDNGEFETAIKHLETLEARFPFDPYAKQAQLDIAYSYYKFDEPDAAIGAADRFIRLHPRDPNIDYIYYLKGLVNFNRGSGLLDRWVPRDKARHETETLENAFNDFATLVRRYPDSRYAGDAYQRMLFLRNEIAQHEIGVAEFYLQRKAWMAAINRAKYVLERYQGSIWRNRALEIIATGYTELGMNELADDARRVLALNSDEQPVNVRDFEDHLQPPPQI